MKGNSGYSLIELVIVIVILSILSVTAYSEWLSFQEDARIAKINGLKGPLEAAEKQVQALSVIQGKDIGEHSIDIQGTTVEVTSGYPVLKIANINKIIDLGQGSDNSITHCKKLKPCKVGDWYITDYSIMYPDLVYPSVIIFSLNDSLKYQCSLIYQYVKIGSDVHLEPEISIVNDGC
ncbi:prepilin-type N-terminal cleavage/methylation domain-containing protein [Aliivibrio sp. S3MY1]|uniref:type II secretion system protein n=1 Tax=unclassified Aliivibrio TaxID=2645654 RepID=UPI002378162E|nr:MULTISPECIES: prepilin-type N-terminal cleavage/methylation domain-containing protein [unclassified Aliivibrio]MDD9197118.1 prepilin-type N-terminal cleavage/methylation domain-containing protein [Aliivibrio sp. S3MY1]MDD9199993.1 prepilin-type N-terminal cleavage/methylation domain-containing protein [Aliivibrio sp. S2MY1]